MSKPADFTTDLSLVAEGVEVGVKDVLKVLRQKSEAPPPTIGVQPTNDKTLESRSVDSQKDDESRSAVEANRPRKAKPQSQPKPTPVLGSRVAKERLSTRISTEAKELLEEAKNWQKVKKLLPDDFEDIIEEALRDWFVKMGYAK